MTDHVSDSQGKDHGHGDHGMAHVMPVKILLGVFFALIALTALTVAATWVDLGWLNIWLAMGIAVIKGSLVCLFFMHLLYDNRFNALVFLSSLCFVFLFVSLAMFDAGQTEHSKRVFQNRPPATLRGK